MKRMASKNIQPLRGFRDFLPEDALKRAWLKTRIIEVFELWGYDPMETPTLEPLELFEGQIGEEEKLFFKFEDPGKRKVALRYDQTVPTCRVVGTYAQSLPFPFRRYQIQPAFRAERPQSGRYREFVQCDADIFGVASPLADAEVIALGLDIYRKLGFPSAKVLLSDRALLRDIPYQAIAAIDKLKKIGETGVIREMVKKGIPEQEGKKYLDFIENLKPNETVQTILTSLKSQGFKPSWYEFDPTIARSFSYSTGPIWEIVIPGFSAGSVLGGERFDALIEQVSGVKIPGTGFGLGFDRTLEAAEQFGLLPDFQTKSKVLITTFDEKTTPNTLKLAGKLRLEGITTETYPDASSRLSKQLKYAAKKGIPYVVILGEAEIARDELTVKDMNTGVQKRLTLPALIKLLTT